MEKKFYYTPINPRLDGVEHLNCYSKAKTKLGRDLSHFAHMPFTYFEHGQFSSIEAFWHWNSTDRRHNHLKPLYGFKAKEEGKKIGRVERPRFLDEVEEAILFKFMQNPWLLEKFKDSILPIQHYYTVGEGLDQKAIDTPTSIWFKYFYTKLRNKLSGRVTSKGLRVVVAGSRTITDYRKVCEAIEDSRFVIQEIVSGGANGVDTLAERYAKERNIPFKLFKADWDGNGKAAGYIRNEEMAEYGDALVALIENDSKGTKHSINLFKKLGKTQFTVTVTKPNLVNTKEITHA